MKAVTLGDHGVEIKELPNPEPTNEQVLVKVNQFVKVISVPSDFVITILVPVIMFA